MSIFGRQQQDERLAAIEQRLIRMESRLVKFIIFMGGDPYDTGHTRQHMEDRKNNHWKETP